MSSDIQGMKEREEFAMLKDVAILDKDSAKIIQLLKIYFPPDSELLKQNTNMLMIEGVIDGLDYITPVKIALVAEDTPGFFGTRDQARMRDTVEQATTESKKKKEKKKPVHKG